MPQRCQKLTQQLEQIKAIAKDLGSELILVKQTRDLTNCRQLKQEIAVRLEKLDRESGWNHEMLKAWTQQNFGLNMAQYIMNTAAIRNYTGEIFFDRSLVLNDYVNIKILPDKLRIKADFWLKNCTGLGALPDNLQVGGELDVRGCTNLSSLSDNLQIGSDLRIDKNSPLLTQAYKLKKEGKIKGEIILY
ncbi:MAG: hypothetical protein WCW02_01210 [Candidatus Buchananbacteria bacterium]